MRNLEDVIADYKKVKCIPSWVEFDSQSVLRYMISTPPKEYPRLAKNPRIDLVETQEFRDEVLDIISQFQESKRLDWAESVTMFSGWKKKWKDTYSDSGDLDVSEYIAGSELPFEEGARIGVRRDSGVIFHVDVTVNAWHRDNDTLSKLQKQMYPLILNRLANNQPTKVITTAAIKYAGSRLKAVKFPYDIDCREFGRNAEQVTCKGGLIFVLKDWNMPISDAVWGMFSTNRVSNRLLCWWCDAISGTGANYTGSTSLEMPEWYPPVVFVAPKPDRTSGVTPREGIDKAIAFTDDNGNFREITIREYLHGKDGDEGYEDEFWKI